MKINVTHVQVVRATAADGTVVEYAYFRAPGMKRIRLPAPTDPAFMAAYQNASAAKKVEPKGGSLRHLITQYKSSPHFLSLAARTRKDYAKLLTHLEPLGEMPLVKVNTAFIEGLQATLVPRLKWRTTNYLFDIFRSMWRRGSKGPRRLTAGNPFEGLEDIPRPANLPKRNRRWSDNELAAALDLAEQRGLYGLRAGLALAAYTGMRRADVISVEWSAVKAGRLAYTSKKTGVYVDITMPKELVKILKSTPRSATSPTIVVNDEDAPYTPDGINSSLKKLRGRLGTSASGLALHGLRHTVGATLAEAGRSSDQIKAVLGHLSDDMASEYTRTAEKRRLGNAATSLDRKFKKKAPRKRARDHENMQSTT
jgi:integrase